jgi:hypothetical protein
MLCAADRPQRLWRRGHFERSRGRCIGGNAADTRQVLVAFVRKRSDRSEKLLEALIADHAGLIRGIVGFRRWLQRDYP